MHQIIGAACEVATISVTKEGTQTSYPTNPNVFNKEYEYVQLWEIKQFYLCRFYFIHNVQLNINESPMKDTHNFYSTVCINISFFILSSKYFKKKKIN